MVELPVVDVEADPGHVLEDEGRDVGQVDVPGEDVVPGDVGGDEVEEVGDVAVGADDVDVEDEDGVEGVAVGVPGQLGEVEELLQKEEGNVLIHFLFIDVFASINFELHAERN